MEPIKILCDSEIIIKNIKTGKIYKDEEEVKLDTSAKPEDIKRDVKIIVPSIALFNKSWLKEIVVITNSLMKLFNY